uniref:Uncharacterized protein n=1 Tax=viral metagenome TaxID=1070528 RepID=A0A6C0EBN0_9ZZZZ
MESVASTALSFKKSYEEWSNKLIDELLTKFTEGYPTDELIKWLNDNYVMTIKSSVELIRENHPSSFNINTIPSCGTEFVITNNKLDLKLPLLKRLFHRCLLQHKGAYWYCSAGNDNVIYIYPKGTAKNEIIKKYVDAVFSISDKDVNEVIGENREYLEKLIANVSFGDDWKKNPYFEGGECDYVLNCSHEEKMHLVCDQEEQLSGALDTINNMLPSESKYKFVVKNQKGHEYFIKLTKD